VAKIQLAALMLAFTARLIAHDWLIVPGVRVGPVTAVSNEAELRATFGAGRVRRAQIRLDEKTTAPGLSIYSGQPGESLAVVRPRNEGGLRWPLLVIPCYGQTGVDCRWRTQEGVRAGMGLADLEKLNGKPFLLYPDLQAKLWKYAWWKDGQLAARLGEDLEVQFEMHVPPDRALDGYLSSDQQPLSGSALPVGRMFVYLLSAKRNTPNIDWTIGGPFWQNIAIDRTELLRESLGPDQAHKISVQGEEGIGEFPGISLFPDRQDASVVVMEQQTVICGLQYEGCRWRLPPPFALIMALDELQKLNGRPFLFNGFAWDFGGVVTSWDGGKLEKRWPGAKTHIVDCKGNYPGTMMGDGVTLRSDDPALRKLDCSVLYR